MMQYGNTGNVALLEVHGALDSGRLPKLKEEIYALAEGGAKRFVFNLHGLTVADPSAISFLIQLRKWLLESRGDLVLSAPSRFMQTTIATLSLDRVFRVFPNDEEAFAYLGEDGGDDLEGSGARLKPRRPSGSAGALPGDHLPDLTA